MNVYLPLAGVIAVQVITCVLFYFIENKTSFNKINYVIRHIIIGVVFGILSIIGNEFGVFTGQVTISVRDAAPVMAGLFFSGPAAILAGLIGGLERFFWSAGDLTRIACSLATLLSGVITAIVRKVLFSGNDNNKKVSIFHGVVLMIVIEVVHMSIVFVFGTDNVQQTMEIIRLVILPMIIMNSIGVVLSILIINGLFIRNTKEISLNTIDKTFRRMIFANILIAIIVTTSFVDAIETGVSNYDRNSALTVVIQDVQADIDKYVNESILNNCYMIRDVIINSSKIDSSRLQEIAAAFNCAEISLINSNGIIYESSMPDYYGFDMKSGKQSMEFVTAFKNGAEEFVQDFQNQTKDDGVKRKYVAVKYGENEFLQVGYDQVQYTTRVKESIQAVANNRHIGEEGYVIVCDNNGNIISTNDESYIGRNLSSLNMILDQSKIDSMEVQTEEVDSVYCYTLYGYTEGYYIIAIMPVEQATYAKDVTVYLNIFIEIMVFDILFLVIFMLIKSQIVKNINTVNSTLAEINAGNLNAVVNVRSNEEFASLSDDINYTVATLKKYIEEADKRIDDELGFAKTIQSSALPRNFSIGKNRNLNIYAAMNTAKEVGGDFYDFFFVDSKHFMILIADVSGKGIPAAMFMMQAKTEIETLTEQGLPVNEIFEKANNKLCSMNEMGMFVTAWIGIIDTETGLMKYSNAGHNPPVLKKNGEFKYLACRPSLVLAGMENIKYRVEEIQFEPTDKLFLYTDGVTESINKDEELYGEDRLLECLNKNHNLLVHDLINAVFDDVTTFAGGADQFDDITMLSIEYLYPSKEIVIDNKLEEQQKVLDFLESELEAGNCSMKSLTQINVAVDEILSNIIYYAYEGEGKIKVKISINDGFATIIFVDQGKPYNPLEHNDPDVTLNAEDRGVGGLGIFIVKKTMDEVTYARLNEKNVLTIIKKL